MGAMRWLEMLAIGIWVFRETNSPELVAVMVMLRMLPMALLGSVTGVFADLVNRKWIMVVSLALMAVVAGVLGALVQAESVTLWHIGLGAFISGACWSTDLPVRRTIMGEKVGRSELGTAMSLDSASNNATRMAGPVIGGALFAAVGLEGAYYVAAGVYVLAALFALSVAYEQKTEARRDFRFLADLRQGFAYLRKERPLIGHLSITVLINLFAFPYISMAPVVGRDTFALDPVGVGFLVSAEGAGAFAGSVLIAFLARPDRYRQIYLSGSLLFILGILVFSLTSNLYLGVVALIAGGFGIAGFAAMQSAIMFGAAPVEIRSRLMGILVVCIGAGPLGVVHVGWLAGLVGGSEALTIIAVEGLVSLILVVYLFPEIRR